jgi:hypothetical protein
MNISIPDDSLNRVSTPPMTVLNQMGDTFGEQSVAVQVSVAQTQQPYFSGSDKTTKRPMKPPPDAIDNEGTGDTQPIENTAIDVVGSDGKLNKVAKHSSWVAPTTYPTFLKTSTTGNTQFVTADSNGLEIDQGTYKARIWFASLTKDMSIKEIDVCVGGVNKKMLILASDPY